MASAFFAGFADTLKDIRLDDRKRTRDLEDADALQRLKKKYESEIVDNQATRIVGSDEVRYNKFGDEISRRTLSPEELNARKAELAKTEADARRAGAEADLKGKEVGSYDQTLALDMDYKRSAMSNDAARVAQGWDRNSIDRERLAADKEDRSRAEADKVTEILFEAGDVGDVSAMSVLAEYDDEMSKATTEQEKQRVIAKYLGTARNLLNTAKQKLRGTGQQGPLRFPPLDTNP